MAARALTGAGLAVEPAFTVEGFAVVGFFFDEAAAAFFAPAAFFCPPAAAFEELVAPDADVRAAADFAEADGPPDGTGLAFAAGLADAVPEADFGFFDAAGGRFSPAAGAVRPAVVGRPVRARSDGVRSTRGGAESAGWRGEDPELFFIVASPRSLPSGAVRLCTSYSVFGADHGSD